MTQIKKFQGEGHGEDGTQVNETSQLLTQDDFITQKLQSIRNTALERSRNKTQEETTSVHTADVYGRKAFINKFQQNEYNKARFLYNKWLNHTYNQYKKNNPIISEKYTKLNFIENDADVKYFSKELNKAKKLLEAAKNGKYEGEELKNCIANLSEMFPHGLPYGNQTFASNPEKYGFSLIDTSDVEPGDLVQHLYNNTPQHAMIYNGTDEKGKHTFNYSGGNSPRMVDGVLYGGYGTNKHYPDVVTEDGNLQNAAVYRYTGTPQDSVQWINEYISQYGHASQYKNGGHFKSTGDTLNYFNFFK